LNLHSVVCIIGAGPSGAATSIFLSRLGIKHIIVDSATFPRNKTCGDGLDLKSVRMLNHIDPAILSEIAVADPHFTPSWGFRFITPQGRVRNFEYKPLPGKIHQPPFFVCKRMYFDHFLVKRIDKQTATFLQGTKVVDISRNAGVWHITAKQKDTAVSITCNLLIGADGDHSVVLRYLGQRTIQKEYYAGSVRQYWKNIAGLHEKNLLELYYPKDKPFSYFWIFPLPNGEANVGFGVQSDLIAKHDYDLKHIFNDLITTDKMLKHRFADASPVGPVQGWGLPLASLQRKASGDGYLLVGDAASLVSPVTGEGIGTGMMSGYVAAHFAKHAIEKNNFNADVFAHYNREIYKRLMDDVKTHRRFQLFPRGFNWMVNHLNFEHPIINRILQNAMRKWVNTAYNAPLKVKVD